MQALGNVAKEATTAFTTFTSSLGCENFDEVIDWPDKARASLLIVSPKSSTMCSKTSRSSGFWALLWKRIWCEDISVRRLNDAIVGFLLINRQQPNYYYFPRYGLYLLSRCHPGIRKSEPVLFYCSTYALDCVNYVAHSLEVPGGLYRIGILHKLATYKAEIPLNYLFDKTELRDFILISACNAMAALKEVRLLRSCSPQSHC